MMAAWTAALAGALTSVSGASSDTTRTEQPVQLSVPALYKQDLVLPGRVDHFLRPRSLFYDPWHDELFVVDGGNNRVVIFDSNNVKKFEFYGKERFSSPLDIGVNAEGYIYLLVSTQTGRRVMQFDFDGLYLGVLELDSLFGRPYQIVSLTVASDGLYLLEKDSAQIVSIDWEGRYRNRFSLAEKLAPTALRELVTGGLTYKDGKLYLPLSNLGTVAVYEPSGRFVRFIGSRGSAVGQLNFPVAVTVSDSGIVLVLDNARFNVVCYSLEGDFLGEFGGKGISPGWFYRPTLLAINGSEDVYVGQIMGNKIQVCRLPEFIGKRHRALAR